MIIDGHCDVLYKLGEDAKLDFYNPQAAGLDVSYEKMVHSDIKVQFFAIYVPERITGPRFDHYLEYVDHFYRRVIRPGHLRVIRTRGDLQKVMEGKERGALLTLEGADALAGNPVYLRVLYQLGVRMIGPTWNYGNWAADGVLEPRQGGFTARGRRFIKECSEMGILMDASHLSDRSFWDLADSCPGAFVATHSNARAVCGHPRNLTDSQLLEIMNRDGRIGVTFVPWFVHSGGGASLLELLRHMEHICSLGGEGQLALGSDFDGISEWIPELHHAGQYGRLKEELLKVYTEEQVEGFLGRNWHRFLAEHLPLY